MSDIHFEFERHLAAWQTRYAGRPRHELVCLYLLALEREENVAVAYSERVLGQRLASLPVTKDVRELMRSALRQIWQDEEEHVIYVRAALQELGNPVLRVRAFLQQTAGIAGGWTVAVRQHRRWADAPLSRAAATLLLWAGGLGGRVPGAVRRHLDYCSFRDFCSYNVHTEGTAWLCWRRLTELAQQVPALCGQHVKDFRRIADDEERHRRVFKILADTLTNGDRLSADVTPQNLSERLVAAQEMRPECYTLLPAVSARVVPSQARA
jgi:rubrerythrin